MQKPFALASLLASVALLAACGGGGGGGSAAPAPAPGPAPAPAPAPSATYDALAAWTQLMSTSRTWTVNGQGSDGLAYQLSLAVEPGGAAVFPVTGAAAVKSTFRNRLVQQSTGVLDDVLNEQFVDTDYRLLGARVSSNGGTPTCSRTIAIAALPQPGVLPGAGGPLYAAATLSECSATATELGTSRHTWSVRAEGGVTFLCIASINRFLTDTTDRLSETCVETDAAGNLGQRARIQLTLPGFSVTATN